MNRYPATLLSRISVAGLCLMFLGACNTIRPDTSPRAAIYSLDAGGSAAPKMTTTANREASRDSSRTIKPGAFESDVPTLIVNPPHAAPGFDSPHIIYVREAGRIEYFAHSEWVDTPARMLAPLLVAALSAGGAFRAVALTPSAASGELRLDTEIVRLQHEFLSQPSQIRFTLRAYLVDDRTRRVVAWREFDSVIPAASDDPRSGILAAGKAIRSVLDDLAIFCADASRKLTMDTPTVTTLP